MSVGPPPYQSAVGYNQYNYPQQPSAPPVPATVGAGGLPPYGTPYPPTNNTQSGPGYATAYPNDATTGGYENPSFGVSPNQQPRNSVESGVTEGTNQWITSSFSDKSIRMAFIRKVYLILLTQLAFTFTIVCVFSFSEPIKKWMQSGANQALYWVSYAVFLVTYIILVCIPSVRRNVPGNYICLSIFTLALTYMTATISSYHNTYIVLVAIGITAALCLAISLFAIQTKIDFTLCSGLLFALVMVLFYFGLSLIICYAITRNQFGFYVMNCVYGGLAALVFGLFLAYDTQLLIGGRRYELSEEEYVTGALELYIDVVYIFLIILGLFGSSK